MSEIGRQHPLKDAIVGLDIGESRAVLERELELHRRHLQELPKQCDPLDRAKLRLAIAQTLLGLNKSAEAWGMAREVFDVLVAGEHWQAAIEACDIMYQSDQDHSIVALGHGVWLAVTYPVSPQLTIDLLNYIVDETPDNSDGAAVAAAVAHYIADLRTEDEERKRLMFFTAQILAQVAKRHRGMEDEEGINIWMEILQLNDPKVFLPKLAKVIDVIVGDHWWIDRDALRARLPVN
ncbi:MAG: hypothetical protein GY807_00355 [Gammaproteobacteria bacterium]|nr:hypothetical protein [Gammaproteobacteria bacterium]